MSTANSTWKEMPFSGSGYYRVLPDFTVETACRLTSVSQIEEFCSTLRKELEREMALYRNRLESRQAREDLAGQQTLFSRTDRLNSYLRSIPVLRKTGTEDS